MRTFPHGHRFRFKLCLLTPLYLACVFSRRCASSDPSLEGGRGFSSDLKRRSESFGCRESAPKGRHGKGYESGRYENSSGRNRGRSRPHRSGLLPQSCSHEILALFGTLQRVRQSKLFRIVFPFNLNDCRVLATASPTSISKIFKYVYERIYEIHSSRAIYMKVPCEWLTCPDIHTVAGWPPSLGTAVRFHSNSSIASEAPPGSPVQGVARDSCPVQGRHNKANRVPGAAST